MLVKYLLLSFGFVLGSFVNKDKFAMSGFMQTRLSNLPICHLDLWLQLEKQEHLFPKCRQSRSLAGSYILCGIYNQDFYHQSELVKYIPDK